MKPLQDHLETLSERARLYAALHDGFRPVDAITWANGGSVPDDTQTVARALAMLRPDCGALPAEHPDPPLWSMRPAARRKILATEMSDDTEDVDFSTPITDALTGKRDYAPARLAALAEQGRDIARIAAITGTLDRAGPRAKGYKHLVALRGLLNRLRAEKRTDAILSEGFVGREDELARLARWIAKPQSTTPLKAIYISGMAGIGKSFLMEQAVQNARLKHLPIFVRLDFDRSGLNVLDRESFIDEISRQVGDGLPEISKTLRELRLKIAGKDAPVTDSKQTEPQQTLIETLARAVRASGRTLLIILDTLEVLRSAGETRIEALFENLDLLSHAGIDRISIIAAGRGNALEPAPNRITGKPLWLTGLPDHAARAFLRDRNVPDALWPRVMALARGNPLFLLLAAKAIAQDGFDEAELPDDITDETVGGYLYRAILSRLPAPLNRVATEALLLRDVTPEILLHVVAPVTAPDLTRAGADKAFELLKAQDWLVSSGPDGTEVQHRIDVRRAFLPLIYAADPNIAASVNRRAVDWFSALDPFETLYHQLQLVRIGDKTPNPIPTDQALRFDEFMLEELPASARDAVRHAQGRRSDFGRAGDVTTTRHPDARAVTDLDLLLKKGDLREAGFVIENALNGEIDPDSPAARLMLCHHWLTGRWSLAQKALKALPEAALEQAVIHDPLLRGRVLLELYAEYDFDTLAEMLRDPALLNAALHCHTESARIGMAGGALDFALIVALAETAKPPQLGLARGILAHNGLEDWQARERAREMVQSRRHRHGLTSRATGAAAQAIGLACLSPFGPRLRAYLAASHSARPGAWLVKAATMPRTAAQRYTPTLQAVDQALPTRFLTPPDVAAGFDLLGLTAEWATGFAAFNTIPDFPALARAADRWRRVAAGEWCWGKTRPPYFVGTDGDADRVTLDRAKRLIQADDPVHSATRELLFWGSPTHPRAEATRHLLARFARRSDRAHGLPSLPATLRHLTDAGIPPLLAAPLAVLATKNILLKDALSAT